MHLNLRFWTLLELLEGCWRMTCTRTAHNNPQSADLQPLKGETLIQTWTITIIFTHRKDQKVRKLFY